MRDEEFLTDLIDVSETKHMMKTNTCQSNLAGDTSNRYEMQSGVREAWILSPYLVNINAENVMRTTRSDESCDNCHQFTAGGNPTPELRYEDHRVPPIKQF